MNFRKFCKKVTTTISDKSPEILLVSGVITFGVTVVLACVETTKISEIKDKHDSQMDDVNKEMAKKASNDPEYRDDEYDENDAKRDKFIITCHTCTSYVKNYAPAIIFGAVSISCFLSSYKILKKRYVAASTLAASLYSTLNSYRERVRNKVGEAEEKHLFYNTHDIDNEVVNDKGKKKTEKLEVLDPNDSNVLPIYAKFFDESCKQWTKDPTINLTFLRGMQARANDLFRRDGYLILNDVYGLLGIPKTDIGSEVGWFESHGDQFVDFGIYDGTERGRAFVNGYERSFLLNFNCVPKWKGDLEAA